MNEATKKMINEGWAISEKKMLNKFSQYAKEGWILQDMSLFYFNFKKGNPMEAVYSMDYQEKVEDREEYLKLFEQSGWNFICENHGFYIFTAKPGTVPIHTDRKLLDELRAKQKRDAAILLIISFLCLAAFSILSSTNTLRGLAEVALLIAGMVSAGIFGMSLVLNWGYYFRKDN